MSYNVSTYKPRGNYKINQFLLNRNRNIRDDFRRMKNEGVRNRDAFYDLAQKYFLSEGTINSIIYARKQIPQNS